MNNTILKYLSAENFASFAEKVEFTTEIDAGKKDSTKKTFSCGDNLFNKVSFLYGANGSGKTFFCKIIREIQRWLNWSPLTALDNKEPLVSRMKGIDEPIATFAFDKFYSELPTCLAIEIILDDITYHYEFSSLNRKIEYELLTKKYRRTEKLIERTSSSYKDIYLKSELKDFENMKRVVKDEALCLPLAALLNNELAMKICNAIESIEVVSMTAARVNPSSPKESFSDARLSKYINIMQKADPTLRNVQVSYEEEEISRQNIDSDDFENREIITKKMRVNVDATHAVYEDGQETDSTSVSFFADESLGTVKLFTVLPYLFDILEVGGVLVIDEIENGLHLSLVKEIIALFMNEKSNPHNAQLICTSHQPLLLEGDFRRDQVWIASKDNFGKSSLYRLSSYKTSRAKVNLTNRILNGAFGCNPAHFFSNNTFD